MKSTAYVKCKVFTDNEMNWGVRVVRTDAELLVEFYDYCFAHTPFGQFVSRYQLTTLMNINPTCGLNLEGGVPKWSISPCGLQKITQWLREVAPCPVTM